MAERFKIMTLTIDQWHQRYQEQSRWTASLRKYIFDQINFISASTVLEVGCGTGAVLSTCLKNTAGLLCGLDIQLDPLIFASKENEIPEYLCADGTQIPFQKATFDITFCHYLLLWLASPERLLKEMKRVTKPGGFVVALAEPDYASRVDAPQELVQLGQFQNQSLEKQGVNLRIGRQLPELFIQVGLQDIRFGVSGFQKNIGDVTEGSSSEWQMIEHDLEGTLSPTQLSTFKELDKGASMNGSRVLWVPTFYAFGKV